MTKQMHASLWLRLMINVNKKYYRLSPLDIGRDEKWKNDILKYADVDYYGTIYIKQGSIEKNRIFKILAGCFFVLKF